ncbi:MAG: hypothetical protein ACI4QI_06190 [Candidatus Coproplasma sp.]
MGDNNIGGVPGVDGGANNEAEIQRRIDQAVTKALNTQKSKLDKEYSEQTAALRSKLTAFENAGLTDAEKAAKQIADAAQAQKDYEERVKRLDVKGEFVAMGVDENDFNPIIDDFFKGDFKSATAKIAAIVDKKADEKAQKKYNKLIEGIPDAKTGKDGKTWTREEFGKLTYSQQMAEISKNPELAKLV